MSMQFGCIRIRRFFTKMKRSIVYLYVVTLESRFVMFGANPDATDIEIFNEVDGQFVWCTNWKSEFERRVGIVVRCTRNVIAE